MLAGGPSVSVQRYDLGVTSTVATGVWMEGHLPSPGLASQCPTLKCGPPPVPAGALPVLPREPYCVGLFCSFIQDSC